MILKQEGEYSLVIVLITRDTNVSIPQGRSTSLIMLFFYENSFTYALGLDFSSITKRCSFTLSSNSVNNSSIIESQYHIPSITQITAPLVALVPMFHLMYLPISHLNLFLPLLYLQLSPLLNIFLIILHLIHMFHHHVSFLHLHQLVTP